MRMLKRLLTLAIVLIIALLVIAFVLPKEVSVARSTLIAGSPEAVFPHVNSLRKFTEWSPWTARDPDMKIVFSGPDEGVGARSQWQSDHPQVGSGSQEITASVPNRRVETALDFGDQGIAKASFDLIGKGDSTEVTWAFETDLGYNPIARYMGLMFDTWIGSDYETGLARLKQTVERGG